MNAVVNSPLETAAMDPALAGFLAQAAAQGNPPLESLPPVVARQIYRDLAGALGSPPPPIGAVNDSTFSGPCGPLRLRLYSPEAVGPWPVLLYVHGGGFVIGDLETHDKVCRTYSPYRSAGCFGTSARLPGRQAGHRGQRVRP